MSESNDELLQSNDDYVETEDYESEDVAEPEDTLDDEPASESAPDSETEHEEKDGKVASSKVEERIGELTRKQREAERLAKQREEELQKLQQQILDSQEPMVPELPDPDAVSEAEFKEAVRMRDQAIQQKIQWQQQKTSFEQQQQHQTQQQQLQAQQDMVRKAQTYSERATKLGIRPEELQQSAAVINQVGLNDDIASHILEHEIGPAITRHLANNIDDLLEVAGSNPIRAALYIEQKIKPKLNPQKRKSGAPRPPNKVKGGTPNRNDKFPLTGGRATFE